MEIEEFLYYYAFVFEFEMNLLLEMTITEIEEMTGCKVAIELWKNSD
ncbi:hypothetical protein [Streptococcus cameli]